MPKSKHRKDHKKKLATHKADRILAKFARMQALKTLRENPDADPLAIFTEKEEESKKADDDN